MSSSSHPLVAAWRYVLARRSIRGALVAVVGIAGVTLALALVNDVYPVRDWLFWRLLELWGWSALLHTGCVAVGYLAITRAFGLRNLPLLEKLVASMASGLVAFITAMYVAGALAWFNSSLAVLLPAGMIAIGAPAALSDLVSARLHLRPGVAGSACSPRRLKPLAFGRLEAVIFMGGVLCLVLVYLQCMTPASLNYDSRWYHLAVGEDYARAGRIVPFFADYNRAYPQLVALLDTWAWLLPGLDEPLRFMMALHTEFFLFVWTLLGVSAGVGWLLGGQRSARTAGAAFFLFPVIFVYDSNIGGSADRVLAFFTPPLFLAAARAAREHPLSPRHWALVGVFAAGATLTKYQSVFVLVPIAVILAGGWLRALMRKRSIAARDGLAPAALLGAGLAFVLPHFLKNWIFYHDPVYPFAMGLFHGRPQVPDTSLLWGRINLNDVIPRAPWPERLANAVSRLLHLPFRRPYAFGFTFTMLVPALPFLPRARRVWLAVLASVLAALTWAWLVLPNDRYAQAFLPIMVMVAAAIILRAWELGWLARLGVFALVATQLVWNGDVYFAGADRMGDAIRLIRSGIDGHAKTRFDGYLAAERAIGRRLPDDAVVLFHNTRLSLGVDRRVLQDLPSFQGLITTRKVRTARELWELYKSFGITHVVHERGLAPAYTRQEEVVFAALLARFAKHVFHEGGYEVFELPTEPPPREAPYQVLTLGMDGYADGVYPIEQMGVYDMLPDELKHYPRPPTTVTLDRATPSILEGVNAVLMANKMHPPEALAEALRTQFDKVITYSERASFSVYIRMGSGGEQP